MDPSVYLDHDRLVPERHVEEVAPVLEAKGHIRPPSGDPCAPKEPMRQALRGGPWLVTGVEHDQATVAIARATRREAEGLIHACQGDHSAAQCAVDRLPAAVRRQVDRGELRNRESKPPAVFDEFRRDDPLREVQSGPRDRGSLAGDCHRPWNEFGPEGQGRGDVAHQDRVRIPHARSTCHDPPVGGEVAGGVDAGQDRDDSARGEQVREWPGQFRVSASCHDDFARKGGKEVRVHANEDVRASDLPWGGTDGVWTSSQAGLWTTGAGPPDGRHRQRGPWALAEISTDSPLPGPQIECDPAAGCRPDRGSFRRRPRRTRRA